MLSRNARNENLVKIHDGPYNPLRNEKTEYAPVFSGRGWSSEEMRVDLGVLVNFHLHLECVQLFLDLLG